ncbi:MAG TPA: NAD(P)/FAD-dependent oxidoreductase [Gemmatimonadaceae bacterium]|nr:NAD(P)/FAD-dependent oxidoreductase [Gemmatimonadaceae bacterium]
MTTRYDAVIIGAGPNGLVAARALARRGRKILVLERAEEIGGHTRTVQFAPGFRSPLSEDTGWVPPAVAGLANTDKLQRAGGAVSTTVMGADKLALHLPSRIAGAVDHIRAISEDDAVRWPAFVDRMTKFAGILGDLYQMRAPDIDTRGMQLLPALGVGRKLRKLGRRDMIEFLRIMPMSIQDLLDDSFENDLLKSAIAAAAVRDLQQGPRSGGTTFNFLHYMVGAPTGSIRGRPWYIGGPDAFAQAVLEVLKKRKVEVRTGAAVERIMVKDDAVAGVVLAGGEEIPAEVVLSTVDPRSTFLGMIEPEWLDPELMLAIQNIKMRGCTACVMYAVDRAIDDPAKSFTASVSLTQSTSALERAADAAKYGEVAASPHVELFSPTLRWSHLAPEFKHVVTARVQYAPYRLKTGAWTAADREALEKKATAAISAVLPNFDSTILHRMVLAPPDIEERFGVAEGAMTHGELTLDQILFARPVPGLGAYEMPITGLYFGGSGAHPGPAILGGAGWLAARRAMGAG